MSLSAEQAYSEALEGTAAFELDRMRPFEVSGPDALRYAHGRVTQNVRDLKVGEAAQYMLLTPQGRLSAIGRMARFEDSLLLLAETQSDTSFAEAFLQFKVADQLELHPSFPNARCVYLLGPNSAQALKSLFPEVDTSRAARAMINGEAALVVPAPATPIPGFYLVLSARAAESLAAKLQEMAGIQLHPAADFEVTRISLKIPSAAFELEEKAIATDYDYQQYISFTKGCYTGQEVVEMSTARGRPNRRLVSLSVPATQELAVGTEVHTESGRCGKVSSTSYLPTVAEARCMAFIKNTVAPEEPLFINGIPCHVLC